eukprot:s177_g21.t1
MPPPEHCNKCKVGVCQPGDSWCIGCSSLELAQSLLKQSWSHQGIRATAEEAILSAARLVKAFSNLDRSFARGTAERHGGAAAKSRIGPQRSRSPRRERPVLPAPPPAPPRASSHRDRSRHRSHRRQSRRESEREPPREERREEREPPQEERHPESEESFEEDSEEEAGERDPHVERREPERLVKTEDTAGEDTPGSRPPPEPALPPSHRRERSEIPRRRDPDSHRHSTKPKKKKKKRRGGAKHQKRWREQINPLRRSHRLLGGETLLLARSFQAGLDRRI